MSKNVVLEDEDLRKHTTFKIGGPARYFFTAQTPEELAAAAAAAQSFQLKYSLLSGGSNVVFPDKGFAGLIIKFKEAKPTSKTIRQEKNLLVCDGNVKLADLIVFTLRRGLAGLETLSGIPGLLAGAIIGNAGAYGHSISETLVWVEIFDGEKIRRLPKKECRFGYRHSLFKEKDFAVLRAAFKLKTGDKKVLQKTSRAIIAARVKKYPPSLLCPGSFFKNVLAAEISPAALGKIDQSKIIEGKIPAGYLLETVGAKGMREGKVKVTDYHGNLIMNDGGGTYADLVRLVKKLKQAVNRKFNIALEEEVRYIL